MNGKCEKKGLIFDMDGTLWDSSENVAKSWSKIVKDEGYNRKEITRENIMGVMGKTMTEIADILFSDIEENERLKLLEKCCRFENSFLEKNGGVLYPNLEETLKILQKKYDLYIVSNCQSGYIEAFLKYYGFEKYFKDTECYGNNLKSKGENIALLAQRNNLEKAYYVGDIQGDYDSTKEAGLDFIHAAYGFGVIKEEVLELESFDKLPLLLEDLGF